MKKCILAMAMILVLTACAAEPAEYPQATLEHPEVIEVTSGGNSIEYRPGDENYEKIFSTIEKNWWKTAEGEPDTAAVLTESGGVRELRTASNQTYLRMDQTIVMFQYESDPVPWVATNGGTVEVRSYGFVLPEKQETEENVRNYFVVYRTDKGVVTEGIYTYYFAPELVNDFWAFLAHGTTK